VATEKKNQEKVQTTKQKPAAPRLDQVQKVEAWQALQTAQNAPDLLNQGDVLQLQRAIGNQAVGELIRSGSRPLGSNPVSQALVGQGHIQRDLSEKDEKIKTKVDELVADGKYDEALKHICDKYGFTGGKFTIKTVPPMDTAWATTGGEIKEGAEQELKIGEDLFEKDFTFIVRTIGHEYQHMVQRSQKNPIGNQKEREFLSWSWEALDDSVPKYELKEAAKHAKKALEYYEDMPEDRKKLYEARLQELKDLIKEAEASE
jgi:hypothetical protein